MLVDRFVLQDHEREARLEGVRQFFSTHAVHRVLPGQPPLLGKAPGTRYEWQIYARRALFDPAFAEVMATLALDMIAREIGHFEFQLAGLETASVPVMCAISAHARVRGVNLNVVSVRKNRKDYGLHNWIEGRLDRKRVLLVDDICNSTESLQTAARVLVNEYQAGLLPFTFTVVNKTLKGSRNEHYDKHMPAGFRALYLLDLTDLGLRP